MPAATQVQAVNFERALPLYGAVTAEQIKNRFGHYYTIFWKLCQTALARWECAL
ncbi:MAG: hypothetical protein IPK32_23870 [Verrucomicrobiaceae bacterium]|nr:hypothetical protein [Verrucomicrobiaceae bacterium]